jgi:NADH:ubiquinone oxidoreductase subunit 6 (subunit J)
MSFEMLNFVVALLVSNIVLMVFISSNISISILYLIILFSICGIYIIALGYEFLGLIFGLIMAGAVGIFFIFVIMMLDLTNNKDQYALRFYYIQVKIKYIIIFVTFLWLLYISNFLFKGIEFLLSNSNEFNKNIKFYFTNNDVVVNSLINNNFNYFNYIEIYFFEANIKSLSLVLYSELYIITFIILITLFLFTLLYIIKINETQL